MRVSPNFSDEEVLSMKGYRLYALVLFIVAMIGGIYLNSLARARYRASDLLVVEGSSETVTITPTLITSMTVQVNETSTTTPTCNALMTVQPTKTLTNTPTPTCTRTATPFPK